MFAGPRRLPAIYRLNLQQVGAFGLTVKYSLCVDESQFWVNAEILVVPTAILEQGVGDLCGEGLGQTQLYRGSGAVYCCQFTQQAGAYFGSSKTEKTENYSACIQEEISC